MIKRWIARRAFNALNWFIDTAALTYPEYNECVSVMDILRSKMYKDYRK